MRARTLLLCLALVLNAPRSFSQVLACSNLVGNWEDYWSFDKFYISQDANGNLSGYMTEGGCTPNPDWPITGTISSGQFTFTATNNGCSQSSAAWVTYSGSVGVPGCNYMYGTYTNSVGGSGSFGVDDPYPTGLPYDTKEVDVPTSETSVTPTGAQWNTDHSAPWIQTLAPNSPPGEYEYRGIYEYGNGVGTDTCWFKGSSVPVFDTISTPGFAWTVASKNTWGTDFIGWNLAAVRYYRNKKRVPCSSTFPQLIVIDAAYSPNNPPTYSSYLNNDGNLFYGVAYETNTLGASITAATATSVRNGQTSTNTTWK